MKAILTSVILFLSFLFATTLAVAQTSSTVTTTTNSEPGGETNNNSNSTTKTTVTTSSTTVDNGDARIVNLIYKKYATASTMIGTTLMVSCKNGVVDISGDVTATSQAEEAIILAKSIEGVKVVRSSINVKTNQTITHKPQSPNY